MAREHPEARHLRAIVIAGITRAEDGGGRVPYDGLHADFDLRSVA